MKIVIVGAGKLGVNVAKALLGGDHSVTIIDSEDSVLQKIISQMDVMTINGNAKEIKLLKQLHIDSYDFLIAVTGDDEANLVIASFAKKMCIRDRSLTMESTSRPTYPTSVNFVASTFTNGASISFASLLAISVLPHPVGPIISIFLGVISSLISSERRLLLYLFLKAIATDFFASSCPIIYLSSSPTISLGVIWSVSYTHLFS